VLRTYTRIVGVLLVSLGLAGFAGVINATGSASFYHAAVGVLFCYLGF